MHTPCSGPLSMALASASSRRAVLRHIGAAALVGTAAAGLGVTHTPAAALAAGSDFTIIRAVRAHFGNEQNPFSADENSSPFFHGSASFPFNCPNVDPSQGAVLQFESYDVNGGHNVMQINGHALSAALRVNPTANRWVANVVLIDSNTLRSTGNSLRVQSFTSGGSATGDLDDFILDNIVVFYRTR